MAKKNEDDNFISRGFNHESSNFFELFPGDSHGNEEKSTRYDYEATDRELNSRINEANERVTAMVKETQQKLSDIQNRTEKKLENIKKQIDESKNKVVETLALFAALFTFLSLQVQVFKDQSDPNKILALVLITGGLITFFVLILDSIVKSINETSKVLKIRFVLLYIMSISLIASGILLMKG